MNPPPPAEATAERPQAAVAARLFPFLRWLPLRAPAVRADLVAGISVGLVLVPQSMAYAQLAGLPAYYGLYAAFLPVIIGAMWGSSQQLATGPVAMVSLLTSATLAQFAAPGSESFVALAILLTLMVGVMQLALGVFRLGAVVNFLSHPVIVGFTNAAAIIIALSQLNKMLGVSMGRSSFFLADVADVLAQLGQTHLPTLAMGVGAMALMLGLRKLAPRVPAVLVAVVLGTLVSAFTGFEQRREIAIDRVTDPDARALAEAHARGAAAIARLEADIAKGVAALRQARAQADHDRQHALTLDYGIQAMRLELKAQQDENRLRARALRRFVLYEAAGGGATPQYTTQAPREEATGWRVQRVAGERILVTAGGEVVGRIPEGLPELALPRLDWGSLGMLLSSALVITLVGFMEAISIAKAMATRTRQRIDPNQELIGQGLANLVGSFSQSYPVSGSFSRSAVNLGAGARTGLSSVFSAGVVVLTLLFLTPALYHLPQAVLAAIIVVAVIGLIDFAAIGHAWQAHRHDGICAVATFVATLGFAPHLDTGILFGAGLAIVLFLYRTMSPRVTLRFVPQDPSAGAADGTAVVRFDGRLYFANVARFEEAVLEATALHPQATRLLVLGSGINEIDASGEDLLRQLHRRLAQNGVQMLFADLNAQVLGVLRATGLAADLGDGAFFASEAQALASRDGRTAEPAPAAAAGS